MSASTVPARRQPRAIILLHWGSLALILAAVTVVLLREAFDDRGVRLALLDLHRDAGLLVLAATALRLAARLRHARLPAGDDPWPLRLAAAGVHLALYLLLGAQPLLGWALSDARGQHHALFGVLPLPVLSGADADLADTLADWHEGVAWGLAALVALHAAAALWHHYVRGDTVLRAMLPAAEADPGRLEAGLESRSSEV